MAYSLVEDSHSGPYLKWMRGCNTFQTKLLLLNNQQLSLLPANCFNACIICNPRRTIRLCGVADSSLICYLIYIYIYIYIYLYIYIYIYIYLYLYIYVYIYIYIYIYIFICMYACMYVYMDAL